MSLKFFCFPALIVGLGFAAVPARAADETALIKHLSQDFSDASASGDAKTLSRLLDDRVVFIDESGEVATKKSDIVAGAGPSPAGVSQTLVQKNFKVAFHGNVAVSSFTDSSTVHVHGQVSHADFLSTEVWLRETAGWKMISSQTLAVPIDPPAVTLPPDVLDEYTGTYSGGPGYSVTIARAGADLTSSVNGTKPVRLKAELKDVLFVPSQPRLRRIFERDASGKITGFVSRREGHDIVFRRVA